MAYEITGEPQEGGYIEQVEIDLIETLPPAAIVFDVGANAGDFTQAVIERRPAASVYAFEALPSAQEHLKQRFAGQQNVIVLGALGDRRELRAFYSSQFLTGHTTDQLATFHPRTSVPEVQLASVGEIQVDTVAEFCSDKGISYVHLLKLDCEGHEYAVLLGAKSFFTSIEVIYWEHLGEYAYTPYTREDFAKLLQPTFLTIRPMRAPDDRGNILYKATRP
jgi:FkbM family methyltransferase